MHPAGYFALVLTPASSEGLKRSLATLPKPLAHHCTVRHGTCDPADLPAPFTRKDLNKAFRLKVTGFATRADGGVQAAVVALVLPDGRTLTRGFTINRVPHITVATDGTTEPVEANALLDGGFEALEGPELWAVLRHT